MIEPTGRDLGRHVIHRAFRLEGNKMVGYNVIGRVIDFDRWLVTVGFYGADSLAFLNRVDLAWKDPGSGVHYAGAPKRQLYD